MKMKKVLAAVLAGVMTVSLAACGGGDSKEESASSGGNVLKLGLCMPFTGASAVAGEYARYGVELAVEEINEAGGFEVGGEKYTFEIVEADNEAKPEITNNAYNKLIGQDEVIAIIGPDSSGPMISAGPLATSAKDYHHRQQSRLHHCGRRVCVPSLLDGQLSGGGLRPGSPGYAGGFQGGGALQQRR